MMIRRGAWLEEADVFSQYMGKPFDRQSLVEVEVELEVKTA
jgi:hypothetical protein